MPGEMLANQAVERDQVALMEIAHMAEDAAHEEIAEARGLRAAAGYIAATFDTPLLEDGGLGARFTGRVQQEVVW